MTPPHQSDDEITLPGGIRAKGRTLFTYVGYILAVGVAVYAMGASPKAEGVEIEHRLATVETNNALLQQRFQRMESDVAEIKGDVKALLRSK